MLVRLPVLICSIWSVGVPGWAQITPISAKFIKTESLCQQSTGGKECREVSRSEGIYQRDRNGSDLERVTVTTGKGTTEVGILRDVVSGMVYRLMYRAREATEVGQFKFMSYRSAPLRVIASRRAGTTDLVAVPIEGNRVRNGYKWIDVGNDLVVRREFDLVEEDGTWLEIRQELSGVQVGVLSDPGQLRVPDGFAILTQAK
ncbi:MAG: hypothetical protein IT168_24810 [Bryobacterales bacterium]|nr:hypothetical protein [Bryobacterales bacterium]